MHAYAPPADGFSQRFEETMDAFEQEFHHAVHYFDTVIVPQVRHETGGALRLLAGHLERLADKLDPDGMQPR